MRLLWRDLLTIAGRSWWLGVVSALLLVAAGMLIDPLEWWTAIIFAVGGFLAILEVLAKRSLNRETAEFKVLTHNFLQPLARAMLVHASKTTAAKRRVSLQGVLFTALSGAIAVTQIDGSRASFFRVVREGSDEVLVPVPELSIGRGDAPVSRFRRDQGEGRSVWEAALRGDVTFYANIEASPPPGMDMARARSYKTFISAPIEANGVLVGLLTVNAPREGDLRQDDVGIMRVLATLVGVALTMCGGEWPNDAPR